MIDYNIGFRKDVSNNSFRFSKKKVLNREAYSRSAKRSLENDFEATTPEPQPEMNTVSKRAAKNNHKPFTMKTQKRKQFNMGINTPKITKKTNQSILKKKKRSYSFLGTSGFFCQNHGANPTFLSLNPSAYGVPNPSLGFLPGQVEIIASSHGLITCRAQDGDNTYFVCNPANQTWRQLPKPEFYHGSNSAHALVFEPNLHNIEGKYQLVCAFSLVDQPVIFFEIYSSETNSWRCSSAMCVEFGYAKFGSPGFHIKGMAYWVMSGKKQVLAFDLKNNVYEIMQLPTESLPCGALAQVHNEVCYANISNTYSNNYVMKLYQGMHLKLEQEIELKLEPVPADERRHCRVLPCFEEDRLMILSGSVLYSYEVGGSIEVVRRKVGYTARAAVGAKFVPYVNSLVHVV